MTVYNNLTYTNYNDFNDARIRYESAINFNDKRCINIINDVANDLFNKKYYEFAKNLYGNSLILNNNQVEILLKYADACLKLNEIEKAQKATQIAISLDFGPYMGKFQDYLNIHI